jgi:peptide/nickel transport system permease protein
MLTYLTRRLIIGAFTLLLITFLIYGLIRAMPGSPLTVDIATLDPSRSMCLEDQKRLEKLYGLDKPWVMAYGTWLANLARLDLGRSFSYKQDVTKVIGERIVPTMLLTGSSLLLAYLIAIPIGLWFTARDGRLEERTASTTLYMLYSLPSFVAALFLQMLFYAWLDWLPLFGMYGDGHDQMAFMGQAWDLFKHCLMPVACLTYGSLAFDSRFIHANMQEVIRQDYIRTARAKGVGPVRVLVHHAFRNTMIPLATLLGLQLPSILGGAVIIEQIFSWPGMGSLFFESIRTRDYNVMMGLTLMFAFLTLAGQLLADVLYALADPRVTYS